MFKIGNVTVKNRVVVAPLAGISNGAFRVIAHRFNAGLIYTEMISDKGILYDNKRTHTMMRIEANEGDVALQLFGSDVESLKEATKVVNQISRAKTIDLNLGCPVPKVVRGNGGASLMRDEAHVYAIVKAMVAVSEKPITAKIRSGWDRDHMNAVSLAKTLEKAGVSAIAVHGRTKAQMYKGCVDLSVIKAVKAAVSIPVIGNGDIKTPEDALYMIEQTRCDAVMIGRGVLGNPWLIQQTVDYLKTGTYEKDVPLSSRFAVIKEHAERLIELKGERVAMLEMRSHVPWYIKGLPHASVIKREISKVEAKGTLFEILDRYYDALLQQEKTGI